MSQCEISEADTPQLQRRLLTPLLSKKVPRIPHEDERPTHPTHKNPFGFFFFTWLTPVLIRGYKRTLAPEDMFKLHDKMTVEYLAEKFERIFERRLLEDKQKHLLRKAKERGESIETSSVESVDDLADYEVSNGLCFKSLYETFFWQYTSGLIFGALAMSAFTCTPLLSKKLIAFVQEKAFGYDLYMGRGIGYAIGVALLVFTADILMNQGMYQCMLTGAQIRGIFTKLLLDKSFRLNARSRKQFPASKITAIMSTDVSRVDLGAGFAIYGFVFVFPVGIAIGILCYNLKAPAMVGVGIMIVFLFVAAFLGGLLFVFRRKAQKSTDARVSYMKEILNNLKMIKFYSWEIPYFNIVRKIRSREMNYLLKMEVTRMIIITLASSLTLISSLASFLVLYAIASPSRRNPADIFASVALFAMLAGQFVVLPLSIAGSTDAFLGMKRVASLLAADEIDPNDDTRLITDSTVALMNDKKLAILADHCSFEWQHFDVGEEKSADQTKDADEIKKEEKEKKKNEKLKKKEAKKAKKARKGTSSSPTPSIEEKVVEVSTFKLHDISLEISQGDFVVITGAIGSGKTSLLHALDGSMKKHTGSLSINGSLLMCGTPWIQNTTLKENILFGLPFDEDWYKKVVSACSLEADFDILPAGDRTEIGERGITLSGGQKARVCLARTVYANSSIVLLDDVLSAVDAKVGRRIMNECILGLLREKTVILATHQLSLISEAKSVIFLNGDGSVSRGTFAELNKSNSAFKTLMEHSHSSEDSDDESDGLDVEVKEKEFISQQITRQTTKPASEDSDEKSVIQHSGKLVEEEGRSVNAIGWDVYGRYLLIGVEGFKCYWPLFLVPVVCALTTFFQLFTNNWLSFWISYKFDRSNGFYIGLYATFTALAVLFLVTEFCGVIYILNRASRILNMKAVEKILHVPMSFMDTTPMGRIVNRFTKDTDTLDNEIGDRVGMVVYFLSMIIGILVLCIIYMPWFAIAVPFIVGFFVILATFYQASGREVKRLEAVQRSHVYNNFNEALTGLQTIKAFRSVDRFLHKNVTTINKMNEAYFITIANQRWLDVYLSLLASCFALLISILCVCRVFDIGASSVGLLLSYVIQTTSIISMLVVVFTEVEQDMNSAERVLEYVYKVPQERAYQISETKPPPEWPSQGEIQFKNVEFAYREGLPLTLKNFNVDILPHEKVGICGRTGAGKSSIMVALFRIAELTSGSIVIDGIDVSTLGLHDLRSRLSIIPQDPVLFKGTIRKNLDPFGNKTDDELWDTLRRADIISADALEEIKAQKSGSDDLNKFHLDYEVDDEGENFSLGEKQLVAFARALVRNTKIIVLDEATSSVDYATDSKLQSAITREFSDCTILCIAHRLRTILDYDRVIVMDQGEIQEFDKPLNLFKTPDSLFRQMCDKSGVTLSDFAKK